MNKNHEPKVDKNFFVPLVYVAPFWLTFYIEAIMKTYSKAMNLLCLTNFYCSITLIFIFGYNIYLIDTQAFIAQWKDNQVEARQDNKLFYCCSKGKESRERERERVRGNEGGKHS